MYSVACRGCLAARGKRGSWMPSQIYYFPIRVLKFLTNFF